MNLSKKSILIISIVVFAIVTGVFFLTKKESNQDKKDSIPTVSPEVSNKDSVSVSETNLTISKGSTKTFDITLRNAVGQINITSSNKDIATVSEEDIWLESVSNDTEDVKTITVTGVNTGVTEITVYLEDVASFDNEEQLTNSFVINVTVE